MVTPTFGFSTTRPISPVFTVISFPSGSDGKESTCNEGDLGFIPGWGRSPGGGLANPLQYSCLENPMDRGAWRATVHGVKELVTTERLTAYFFLNY